MANNIKITDRDGNEKIVQTIERDSGGGVMVHTQVVQQRPATSYRKLSLRNTGDVVLAAAGILHGLLVFNLGTDYVYLKIYNKATTPSGSDTPKLTIPIRPTADGIEIAIGGAVGESYAAGISWRVTIGMADNDNEDPGADVVIAHAWYVANA